MQVIFLKDVPRIGKRYDVKKVPDGYAMNFLLPRNFAVLATPKALADLENNKKKIEIESKIQTDLLMKNLEEIKDKVLHIKVKTDDKGHLFSKIHAKEIVKEMKSEHHADINEEFIILEKPIREIGEYEIPIVVKDQKSSFKLKVEKL